MTDAERFERIESLFAGALDRAREDRAAYLEGACHGDDALRAEVERLLDFHDRPNPLDASAPGETAEALATQFARADEMLERIGRYMPLRVIGEGGMGTVYEAQQEAPRRRVALKVIKLGMDTRQVIARFEAERQALAMMDHPCIARVFDAGSTESGRPYFVMELVEGAPLLEYCDTHRLETHARLAMFLRICAAIQHAHQKGIIHRDIKPSNVLVTLQDNEPVPKVIDFGIAKAAHTELARQTFFTEQGQIIGTPAYMAPEQAEMSGLDIDTRADVYALGVLLYELLTGTTPLDTHELRSQGFAEMLRVIREQEPNRPSTQLSTLGDNATRAASARGADVHALSTLLRGDLDWIALKCLEKERSRRYESVSALAADIERHLNDEPVSAGPQTQAYRLRKFVRRNRAGVLAAGAVAVAILLGLVGTSYGLLWALDEREATRKAAIARELAKDEALANERAARKAESEAAQRARDLEVITDFQSQQLSSIDPEAMGAKIASSILNAAPESQHEGLQSSFDEINFTDIALEALENSIFEPTTRAIAEELAGQPDIGSRLFQTAGKTQRSLGLLDSALASLRRAATVRTEHFGPNHELTLHTRAVIGETLADLERFDEALEILLPVLEVQRRALPEGHADIVHTLLYIGTTYEGMGDLEGAERYIQEAHRLARAHPSEDDPSLAIHATAYLGFIARARGRLQEAKAHFETALAYHKSADGETATETLTALANLTTVIAELGDYEESVKYYEQIFDIRRRTLGEEHPQTLVARMNMGSVYWRIGDLEKAESSARETLVLLRDVLGDEHNYTLNQVNLLGLIIDRQGRDEEALALYTEALTTSRRVFGESHPRTLQSINNVAKILRRIGRLEEAEPLQFEVLEGAREIFGPRHPNTLVTTGNTGVLLAALGKNEQAEAMFREALDGFREVFGDSHPETLVSIGDLASHLDGSGRRVEALALCDELVSQSALLYSDDAPRHAGALRQRAGVLIGLERFADAERDLLGARVLVEGSGDESVVIEDLVALYERWHEAEPEVGLLQRASELRDAL